jgi:hypothetical protein
MIPTVELQDYPVKVRRGGVDPWPESWQKEPGADVCKK